MSFIDDGRCRGAEEVIVSKSRSSCPKKRAKSGSQGARLYSSLPSYHASFSNNW